LSLAWELRLGPLRPCGLWLALRAVPLRGLLASRRYTHRGTSPLALAYLGEGLVQPTSHRAPSPCLAAVTIVVALGIFAGCIYFVQVMCGASAHRGPQPVG
jgi:uncharacterized membrane protein